MRNAEGIGAEYDDRAQIQIADELLAGDFTAPHRAVAEILPAARERGLFLITISTPPKARSTRRRGRSTRGRPRHVVYGERRRYTCSTATTPATAFSAPASAPVTA
jgi:hypothetical protein